jgi:hypothetical protein
MTDQLFFERELEDATADASRWALRVLHTLAELGLDDPFGAPPWVSEDVWNMLRRLAACEASEREIAAAMRAVEATEASRNHRPTSSECFNQSRGSGR